MERRGRRLLFVTAAVRLVSRLLDIDVLGGMALVVDVYALALLLGVDRRARALSPGWLAALFTFCLPIERILQRVVGYVLQWIAARAACGVLGLGFPAVHCAGVDVQLAGRHVLVDVPCSGARGLVTLGLLFATVATVVRPGLRAAAVPGSWARTIPAHHSIIATRQSRLLRLRIDTPPLCEMGCRVTTGAAHTLIEESLGYREMLRGVRRAANPDG